MLTTRCWVALPMALSKRFSCRGLGVAGSGFNGAHGPGVYGPAAAKRPASKRKMA
jgi:hypothetical protein